MNDVLESGGAIPEACASPKSILENLHAKCGVALSDSVSSENEAILGESHVFISDLEAWGKVLHGVPEILLFDTASHEYTISLLNVCQGQYRNAFKGLRLVLELCLQGVYLSANLVHRDEWLKGEQDTNWTALVDKDTGPLSKRYCKAFFPDVSDHVANFREMARTVYRELSECIHGNRPNHIPLPTKLAFDRETLALWHEKAKVIRLIVHFALSVRYLTSITASERTNLEVGLLDQLGHIEAVRSLFGGVETT